jgi:tetratricopeptide (TPR) repeat protein
MELYKRSVQFGPENKEAYYNLGNVYARIGKNPEAISSYLIAVEVDPEYMDAWINLSILSFHQKDFQNAVKYYDEAALLGYKAPEGYLKTLEPYRGKSEDSEL